MPPKEREYRVSWFDGSNTVEMIFDKKKVAKAKVKELRSKGIPFQTFSRVVTRGEWIVDTSV